MNPKKVYCKDCYWYSGMNTDHGIPSSCSCGEEEVEHFEESFYGPEETRRSRKKDTKHPSEKNKNNDCPDFHQKRRRISFWTGYEY